MVAAMHQHQWRLPLPTLIVLASVISLPIATAFLLSQSIPISISPSRLPQEHPHRPCNSASARASSSSSSIKDDDDGRANLNSLLSCSALQRLNLSPEQAAVVQKRVSGITPKKQKRQRQWNDADADDATNSNSNSNDNNLVDSAVVQTIEQNLAFLQEHLDLSIEQLRTMVVGYPQVLSMGLETNLMPSIAFFHDALRGSNDNDDDDESQRRLAAFLCESPSLLEYNVVKWLEPRLERVRSSRISTEDDDSDHSGSDSNNNVNVDEEMLRAIATLTDSRFETWLHQYQHQHSSNETGEHNGNSNADTYTPPPTQRQPNNPSSYVILSNLQSGGNIGNIVRSASIFGCEECIVVGQKRYRMTGDHGSRADLPRRHVWSHDDAREYLLSKGKGNIKIYGIEIMEGAKPLMRYDGETGVVTFPFERELAGAAFIFGNEGQGLSSKQREICDEFLFIPQNRGGSGVVVGGGGESSGSGSGGGSASMNVACAATVVLQAYCMWAGYSEAKYEGEKFLAS